MGHEDLLHSIEEQKRARGGEKSPGALRTISEAADLIDVPQHVLRFWETKFPQIKPLKRNGGRRFYRPADLEILQQIKFLLYKQGYTIKGAKKAIEDLAATQSAGNVQDWTAAFPPANVNDNAPMDAPASALMETVEAVDAVMKSVSSGNVLDKGELARLRAELISLRAELTPFIERSDAA